MSKVFVVLTDNLTSGAFNWFPKKEDAKAHYDQERKEVFRFPMMQLVLMELEVEAPLTEPDAVTDEIDSYDTDELLNQPLECFPYTPEVFQEIQKMYYAEDK